MQGGSGWMQGSEAEAEAEADAQADARSHMSSQVDE